MRTEEPDIMELTEQIQRAEQEGFFDDMFRVPPQAPKEPEPSKERLLDSIRHNMRLTKGFFLDIYGYGISDPSFPAAALEKLDDAGCTKAYGYYSTIIADYERRQKEARKRAAAWYLKIWPELYKNLLPEEVKIEWMNSAAQNRKQRRQDLQQMSDKELLTLLQSLKSESLM